MTEIWTDGACEPNPGAGGWGYRIEHADGRVVEEFGGEKFTTNNRMEMTAILQALRTLAPCAEATVYSDSQYCVNGLTVWSIGWAKRDWRKKGEDMPNRDLWLALEEQKRRVKARFVWVRGHSGNEGNERADYLAALGRLDVISPNGSSAIPRKEHPPVAAKKESSADELSRLRGERDVMVRWILEALSVLDTIVDEDTEAPNAIATLIDQGEQIVTVTKKDNLQSAGPTCNLLTPWAAP